VTIARKYTALDSAVKVYSRLSETNLAADPVDPDDLGYAKDGADGGDVGRD